MQHMPILPIGFTKFYSMHQRDLFHSKWLLSIKDCLISSGHDIVWNSQDAVPVPQNILGKMFKLKLIENYSEVWKEWVFIPPANFVCGGYTVFTVSVRACVRPSVHNALFP